MNIRLGKILIPLFGLLCLTPWISSAVALGCGIALALTIGNPYVDRTRKLTPRLLSLSVIGLGAGMNLMVVGRVGLQGIAYTMIGIVSTLLLGTVIGRSLKTENEVSVLVSSGTAICGGSAIAAVAPAIRAKSHQVSVALGIVFLLNASALFLFPWIGHYLHLTEEQFGLWAALAIHDTSSVVGATLQYGPKALEIGTTVKLARALWIIPMTFIIGSLFDRVSNKKRSADSGPQSKPKRPWFIFGFLAAAAIVTWVPALQPAGHLVEQIARKVLVLTLFLIGASLSREALKAVGVKPLIQGFALWVLVGSGTLIAILEGWIHYR